MRKTLGEDRLQGNVDPAVLLHGETIRRVTQDTAASLGGGGTF